MNPERKYSWKMIHVSDLSDQRAKTELRKACRTREDARKSYRGDVMRLVKLKSYKYIYTLRGKSMRRYSNSSKDHTFIHRLCSLSPNDLRLLVTIIDPSLRLIILYRECMNFF
ncbi:GQ67_04407T0 [Komagataella phaffii]|nr:GQ67_04407T0 [Komagataella phaffii]AOA69621.1 GQ68_04379T0 [Komagataella phaffii GS115]